MEQQRPVRWLTIGDVEHYYVHLATGFEIGAIDSAVFHAAMESFKFRGRDGRTWTIGASTGQWYVLEADAWVSADPPAALLGPDIPLMPLPDELVDDQLPVDDLPSVPDTMFRPGESSLQNDDLPLVPQTTTCPSCLIEIEPGRRPCPRCGAELE